MGSPAGHGGLCWASGHHQPSWAIRAIATTVMLVLMLLSTAAPTFAPYLNQFERFVPEEAQHVQGLQQARPDPDFGVPEGLPDLDRHDPNMFPTLLQPESYDWQQQHHTPLQAPQDMANFGTYPAAGSLQPANNHYVTNQHGVMFGGRMPAPPMVYQPYGQGQASSLPRHHPILGGFDAPPDAWQSGSAQPRQQQEMLGRFGMQESDRFGLQVKKLEKKEKIRFVGTDKSGNVYEHGVELPSFATNEGLFQREHWYKLTDSKERYVPELPTQEELQAVLYSIHLREVELERKLGPNHDPHQYTLLKASPNIKKIIGLRTNFNRAIRDRQEPANANDAISAMLIDRHLVLFGPAESPEEYYAAAFPLATDKDGKLVYRTKGEAMPFFPLGKIHKQALSVSEPGPYLGGVSSF